MNFAGVVTREAPKSPIKSQDRVEGGVITYDHLDAKKTIMYFLKDCEKPPRIGDRVRFDIYLVCQFYIIFLRKLVWKILLPVALT